MPDKVERYLPLYEGADVKLKDHASSYVKIQKIV